MTVAERADRASCGRIKVLIVGAGIAGTALAALLERWDIAPALVERARPGDGEGYNLALYPVGSRVLHGLGRYREFAERTVALRNYQLHNGVGAPVQQWDLGRLFDRYGPIAGLRRAELIDLLSLSAGGERTIHEATVEAVETAADAVQVTFGDGSVAAFDLVVGADGIHSRMRELMLRPEQIHTFDTKWACLVSWAPPDLLPADTVREYWGAGFMVGLYPVKGEIGVVIAGPSDALTAQPAEFFDHVRHHLREPAALHVLDLVAHDRAAFRWSLHDIRADEWVCGRVVLLGDAADAFLPTAGVGASMAMLSAAALADELSRTDAAHLEAALRLFVRRQQPKVVAAQQNSRRLARLMMIGSPVMAWGRELLMQFYGPDRALRDIVKVLDGIV